MPASQRRVTPDDIIPDAVFRLQRKERRAALLPRKKLRRVDLGPYCTAYFETYETMLFQIQEMLLIEGGGAEQLVDEMAAYNPLIPQGGELVATVMFEIEDPVRRAQVLAALGGIEDRAFLRVGGETIRGIAEEDQERSRDDGKASSVQFIRFPFTSVEIAAFKSGAGDVVVGFDHPNYGHMAVMTAAVRKALAGDFD